MRIPAGLKIPLRVVAIFLMASFSVAFAGPKVLAPKPHYNIEYYISDGEVVRSFDKSGLSIYSFMSEIREFEANNLDQIPLFGVVNEMGINAMDLDSAFVQTPNRTLFYDFSKQKAGYFFQDFVQDVKENGTVQLYYSATLGKSVLKNLVVSNEGPLPVVVKVPTGESEFLQGHSEPIPFVTNMLVLLKGEFGWFRKYPYMFFSVELDEDATARASQSTLDALASLRIAKRVWSDTVNLEGTLTKALEILDSDSGIEFSSVLFRVEFFASEYKNLQSFVFTREDSAFYDESWKDEISVTGDGVFPTIYREDACFDGWSIEGGDKGGKIFRSSDIDIFQLRSEDEVLALKPNWRYGSECAGVDVVLGAEHGSVELLQVVSGDTVVRSFRDTLRVPRSANGLPFMVRAVPDSAFVLDGENPYSDGIRIDGPMQLKCRFVPGPDPEPLRVDVESGLEVSGNAARLRYSTGEMNIFRKVGFRVTVKGPDGYIVDSLLVDSAEAVSLSGEWRLVPAPVGEYVVEAVVFHDLDSARYVDTLRVAGEIAVDTGAWAMVSLSGVDMQELKWDDDQLFYHWDESYGGAEFWQYRRLKRGDGPSAVDGYWYNSLEGRSLPLVSEPAGEAAFAWELDSLNSGWNLVANPHGYYVDLRAADAGDSVQFWRWNPKTREYEIPSVIGPYEAVWAKVNRPVVWELDGEPVFDSLLWDGPALTRMALAKEGAGDGWEFRVVLSDGLGHRDSWNILGASSAGLGQEEPPAAMGDRVDLTVLGEHGGRLARSVKPFSGNGVYEWTLELQAGSDRDAYVSFAGIGDLGARGLHVYLTVDGETAEVSEGDSVGVRLLSRATVATVRVAPGPRSSTSRTLDGLKFRQSSGQLFVEFDAGNALSGQPARVELLDLRGRVVALSTFGTREGGNVARLRVDRPGLFVARVRVGGRSLASRVVLR